MDYKRLTTVTMMNTAAGPRLSYTYTVIDENGATTAENQRGSLTLIAGMTDQRGAVAVLDTFLTAKLPTAAGTPALKSFCIYAAPEGDKIVFMYDVFNDDGQPVAKNSQGTVTLVADVMADQVAAVATLREFLAARL